MGTNIKPTNYILWNLTKETKFVNSFFTCTNYFWDLNPFAYKCLFFMEKNIKPNHNKTEI